MKNPFVVFRTHHLEYEYKTDFNQSGKFHGAVLVVWDIAKEEDEEFVTHQNRAEIDINTDKKVREAREEKIIDPFQKCRTNEIFAMLIHTIVFSSGDIYVRKLERNSHSLHRVRYFSVFTKVDQTKDVVMSIINLSKTRQTNVP